MNNISIGNAPAEFIYKHLVQTYIGLSAAQIEIIADPLYLDVVQKNVRHALFARKLFKDGKLTRLGVAVQLVHAQIQKGAFSPEPPKMTEGMTDPTALARSKPSKELSLRSGHIKFMRSVLNFPGISIFTMEKIFGVHLFSELISRELVSRHEDSHQIYPTEKGISFMKECIAEVDSKKELKKGKGNGNKK